MPKYQFIDVAGKPQTIDAIDSATAMKAPNIAKDSGVMLLSSATAPAITNPKDANAHINSDQSSDYNTASSTDAPTTRTSSNTYADLFNDLKSSLTSGLTEKPDPINLTKTFTDLRGQYGITDLESNLTTLQSQARELQAASAARTAAERDKPVAMNVIAGRISEEERQDNERLTAINNSIQTVTSQLQTKYTVVDNIMKYSSLDYSNAVDAYDKEFSQNLSLMNTVKGIKDTEDNRAEQEADNARANLQIIYNNLNSGGASSDSFGEAEKANITKLELQAGLPIGFYASLTSKNPKSDILSTTTRDVNGKKFADIIMRNADGSLSTKTVTLGAVDRPKGDTTTTEAELKRTAIGNMGRDLTKLKGDNAYLSPADYKEGKQNWVNAGFSANDYDASFQSLYADPEALSDYGLKY